MTIKVELVTGATRGLQRDAEIVHAILLPHYRTEINISRVRNAHLVHRRLLAGIAAGLNGSRRVLIFFEILPTQWTKFPATRVLVPNQEWMRPEVMRNVASCAEVWCKTHYAETIYREMGFRTRYIGFSSKDIYKADVDKDYGRFIHVAGQSPLKGTKTILDVWCCHPEWPSLTVVAGNSVWKKYSSKNITVYGNMKEAELFRLMNQCGVHLCPSETEGYGHYIAEALSSKALVISVAAPPMNELVTQEAGLLASYHRCERFNFGDRFFVDAEDLQRCIEEAINMRISQKKHRGELAREIFLERQTGFANTLLLNVRRIAQYDEC